MGIVSKDIRSMDEETTTNSRQQSLAMCKGVNSKATNAAQVRSCAQTKGLRFCRRPFAWFGSRITSAAAGRAR